MCLLFTVTIVRREADEPYPPWFDGFPVDQFLLRSAVLIRLHENRLREMMASRLVSRIRDVLEQ